MNRTYLPADLKINTWEDLSAYFEELQARPVNSVQELEKWLKDRSELESAVSEDLAWRYIRMTCNTEDKALEEAYLYFVSEIEPKVAPYNDSLNRKVLKSKYHLDLKGSAYHIYIRSITNETELFREENIPIFVEISTLAQKYAAINGAMMVSIEGKELTLQQAANYLKSPNRPLRQEAFEKISSRRLQDKDQLDELLDQLIQLRTQVARNAGFDNFRDYMHQALGRFDYSIDDCFRFHEAVASQVVPLVKALNEERLKLLRVAVLKPWDMDVDPTGKPALQPFEGGKELLDKTLDCFSGLDPYFKECLSTMNELKHLDLESRKGKAPGGYNYPLAETGIPFIFMNAAGNLRDVETMVHEGGHAIHSFLTQNLALNAFKNCPSEVAELASMSMELVSMKNWKAFFPNKEDLKRAKQEQLEGVIRTLPWIATVDKFQHWLYTNPEHTREERTAAWLAISEEFGTGMIDYTGWEEMQKYSWQKQLHIYEVPFYYIEYGFAQLGAIGVWRNFAADNKKGLDQYKAALSLGYTKGIPQIYETAGVKFDFSKEYVKELFDFVGKELESISR